MLEASKAGMCQADQDGEEQHQAGEQGERSLQAWGQRDASFDGGRACLLHELLCGFSLRPKIKEKTSCLPPSHHLQQLGCCLHPPGGTQSDVQNCCHYPGSISDTGALSQWQKANLLAGLIPSSLQCPGQSQASLLHFPCSLLPAPTSSTV